MSMTPRELLDRLVRGESQEESTEVDFRTPDGRRLGVLTVATDRRRLSGPSVLLRRPRQPFNEVVRDRFARRESYACLGRL